jgi:hypothetical protein
MAELGCKYIGNIFVCKQKNEKNIEKCKKSSIFLLFCPLIGRKSLILQPKKNRWFIY